MTIHPGVIKQSRLKKKREIKRKYLEIPVPDNCFDPLNYEGQKKKNNRGVIIIDPEDFDLDSFKKFIIY